MKIKTMFFFLLGFGFLQGQTYTFTELQESFDEAWERNLGDINYRALESKGEGQSYYFSAFDLEGLTCAFRATGDTKYLDEALRLIEGIIADATPSPKGDGYLGWNVINPKTGIRDEYPLFESYCWRITTTLLRIMHQSPNLMGIGNYQNRYNSILNFTKDHIWDKWKSRGLDNFYRSRTHMASHWARIGMELYLITGEQEYIEVFENISFGTMSDGNGTVVRPSNLRSELDRDAPIGATYYRWSQTWEGDEDSQGNSYPFTIQDTDHASELISFWVNAKENGMYWDTNDIDKFTNTMLTYVWPYDGISDKRVVKGNVDGSGDFPHHSVFTEWMFLGNYSLKVQHELEKYYLEEHITVAGGFSHHDYGIAMLNSRMVACGASVYPESYTNRYQNNLSVTGSVADGEYDEQRALEQLSASNHIFSGGEAVYRAKEIYLEPGFDSKTGSKSLIDGVFPCDAVVATFMTSPVIANSSEDFLQTNDHAKEMLFIYPNPTSDKVGFENLPLKGNRYLVTVYGISGAILLQQNISEEQTDLYVGDLKQGLYVLKILKDKKTISRKLIIKR